LALRWIHIDDHEQGRDYKGTIFACKVIPRCAG